MLTQQADLEANTSSPLYHRSHIYTPIYLGLFTLTKKMKWDNPSPH